MEFTAEELEQFERDMEAHYEEQRLMEEYKNILLPLLIEQYNKHNTKNETINYYITLLGGVYNG